MKCAMLFPGQASHYVGMGKDYYDEFSSVRDLYKTANRKLGFDITELSFNGNLEELTKTHNAQPAILLHSLAVLTVLSENGVSAQYGTGVYRKTLNEAMKRGDYEDLDLSHLILRS